MSRKGKSEIRLLREQRQEMKGFFNSTFRDGTMSSGDWRLIEKGIASFQILAGQREQEDLINVVNKIKIEFNKHDSPVNRKPIRLVYACILALNIIPHGAGNDKTQKDNYDEIILAVMRENRIHHYDAEAIDNAAKEYKELKNSNLLTSSVLLLDVMRKYRA